MARKRITREWLKPGNAFYHSFNESCSEVLLISHVTKSEVFGDWYFDTTFTKKMPGTWTSDSITSVLRYGIECDLKMNETYSDLIGVLYV